MTNPHGVHIARLLPWDGSDGQPCFLLTDGDGYLTRIADNMESVQLGMAGELLDHIDDLLTDLGATSDQLRYGLARMSESLRDVKRIAESRGARLLGSAVDDDRR
ncbi:hypothetical protein [Streptomyces cavernicola]|uniref:Uncharacterized protein n=1 Tax=Streptomyces cavernicola TaxID=3043613 RepID=A0ABT6SMY4_9ACTN|nr:hypothetical protein [Streptomyces sp. B-S-A6]MDI3409057.1 hypothetical protein [Streptomyces sp. B-S-A6]